MLLKSNKYIMTSFKISIVFVTVFTNNLACVYQDFITQFVEIRTYTIRV